ncbi:NAD-P-binding protein [Rickenella mellea]|uniref:NAD-P-binding protein n=1 Tax=Rickenella mellea TaxID=50990 RepID=A0A4Y7Q9T5_9AGAM|nr:NAD-P-binding protein [Rickenella mellea]
MTHKQTVLVFTATGRTGGSVINGLLDSHKFNVIAGIRAVSQDKPEVEKLKSRGAEIRIFERDTFDDRTVDILRGVDVLIMSAVGSTIDAQKQLVDAAKKAGVKRVVSNDWAAPTLRGVHQYYDSKAVLRDYIREVGIGYTVIDVGIWHQIAFQPLDESRETYPGQFERFTKIYGGGDVKSAFTDLRDIGTFVARIIDNPRSLNHYVFIWGEEATKKQILDIAEKEKQLADARVAGGFPQVMIEYEYSVWVRGDNVIEKAKTPEYGGALDARELYPDIKPRTLTDYAQSFYAGSV